MVEDSLKIPASEDKAATIILQLIVQYLTGKALNRFSVVVVVAVVAAVVVSLLTFGSPSP